MLTVEHHGVTGVVAALVTDDHVRGFAQKVDDLSFAFIPPLGSHNHECRHADLFARKKAPVTRGLGVLTIIES